MFDEQPRFIQAKDGVLAELRRRGYREPGTAFVIANAKGKRGNLGPAIESLRADGIDLIVPIGTPAAKAAAEAFKAIPVVFSLVWDPIDSQLIQSWERSGNNVTGSSNHVRMDELVRRLTRDFPVKKMLVVYNPQERHTELMLRALQALNAEGLEIVPFVFQAEEDGKRIPSELESVDCVFLTPMVAHGIAPIIAAATEAGVLTVSGTEEFAAKGALWSLAVDPFLMGRLAGEKAAQALGGADPASIPSEYPRVPELVINLRTARAMRLKLPASLISQAARVID